MENDHFVDNVKGGNTVSTRRPSSRNAKLENYLQDQIGWNKVLMNATLAWTVDCRASEEDEEDLKILTIEYLKSDKS